MKRLTIDDVSTVLVIRLIVYYFYNDMFSSSNIAESIDTLSAVVFVLVWIVFIWQSISEKMKRKRGDSTWRRR